MEIPGWLNSKIDESGLQRIREAVSNAEMKTSAEIVPMIVRRSSAIAHTPMSVFLALAFIWITALPFIPMSLSVAMSAKSQILFELAGIALAFALSFIVARVRWIQRILVPEIDQIAQVDDRAQLEFYSSNIKSTRDSTGILIFVSMLERRAVVLADKSIADKFPPAKWNDIVNGLLERIKKGSLADAFAWAIEQSGELVQPYFPVRAGDTNELENDLIIKE